MNNKDSNLMQLEEIASALGELLPHFTFVGGSTTVLLVDEAAHHGIRKTDDVDVIIDVTTRAEYYHFADKLRALGFAEDPPAPFVVGCSRLKVEGSSLMLCQLIKKY